MDAALLVDLIAKYPQAAKWLALIGAVYAVLSAAANLWLYILKLAGKDGGKQGAFLRKALTLLADFHSFFQKAEEAVAAQGASKGAPKALALLLGAFLAATALFPGRALADPPQLVLEPTPAMVVWHPGQLHPVSVAAASGVFAGVDLFPTTLFGAQVHLLSLGGDLFGSLSAAQQLAGYATVGLQLVIYEAFAVMGGLDLYTSDKTGLFSGSMSAANLSVGVGVDLVVLQRLFLGHQAAAPAPTPGSYNAVVKTVPAGN